MGVICGYCGKDTKAAGHIMAQCMALHNNRLSIKEEQIQAQIGATLTSKGGNRTRDLPRLESQKRPTFATMLVNLRRVPMGQFLRHAVKEMEQMPFVLTRDGIDFAIIGPYNEVGR